MGLLLKEKTDRTIFLFAVVTTVIAKNLIHHVLYKIKNGTATEEVEVTEETKTGATPEPGIETETMPKIETEIMVKKETEIEKELVVGTEREKITTETQEEVVAIKILNQLRPIVAVVHNETVHEAVHEAVN